jgi:ferredoxin--NADP+ reductase
VHPIVATRQLAPDVKRFAVRAPKIARHRQPGQFVIVRATSDGERIPLTIADADCEAGTITLVVQAVGRTTTLLHSLDVGDSIPDVAGPLGTASEIADFGTVVVVGGGVGTAVVYPVAAALADAGSTVVAVIGGRSRPNVLFADELGEFCAQVVCCTDDGSLGHHGLVTDVLTELIGNRSVDRVIAAGPIPMMAAVAECTRPGAIPTVVSLNPIMVDGTGMCGGCRVSVGGRNRFACLDGPEFDAHLVDFHLLDMRNRAYADWEHEQMVELEGCRATTGAPGEEGGSS